MPRQALNRNMEKGITIRKWFDSSYVMLCYVLADMKKVKKIQRTAFWGEKFLQKCVIPDCFQVMTKGHILDFKPKYNLLRLMCDLNGIIHA